MSEIVYRQFADHLAGVTTTIGAGNTLVWSATPAFVTGITGGVSIERFNTNTTNVQQGFPALGAVPYVTYRFYFNMKTFTLADTETTIIGTIRKNGGSNWPLSVRLRRTGAQYTVEFDVKNDAASKVDTLTQNVATGAGNHYVDVRVTRATGPSADDATAEMRLDGGAWDTSIGYDLYDEFALLNEWALGALGGTGGVGIIEVGMLWIRNDHQIIGAHDPNLLIHNYQPQDDENYTATVVGASQTLTHVTTEKLGGTGGDEEVGIVSTNAVFTKSDFPAIAVDDWVASFAFKDLDGLTMADGDAIDICKGIRIGLTEAIYIRYRQTSGVRDIQVHIQDDGGGFPNTTSGTLPLIDLLEFHAHKATDADEEDGFFHLYVNGDYTTPLVTVADIDWFTTFDVDELTLGATIVAGTPTGTFYFGKPVVRLGATPIGPTSGLGARCITITGTPAAIKSALATAQWSADDGFPGPEEVTMTSTDTGSLTDTDLIDINVRLAARTACLYDATEQVSSVPDVVMPHEISGTATHHAIMPWTSTSDLTGNGVLVPFEHGRAAAMPLTVPWDSLTGLKRAMTGPWEILGTSVAVTICPWESQGLLALNAILLPWEALGIVQHPRTIPWEAHATVARAHALAYGWQQRLVAPRVVPHEALVPIASSGLLLYETLAIVAHGPLLPIQILAVVAHPVGVPLNWMQAVATVPGKALPYEGRQQLRGPAIVPLEGLSEVPALTILPLAWMQMVEGPLIVPYESSRHQAHAVAVAWESRGLLITEPRPFPWHSMHAVASAPMLPVDWFLEVRHEQPMLYEGEQGFVIHAPYHDIEVDLWFATTQEVDLLF